MKSKNSPSFAPNILMKKSDSTPFLRLVAAILLSVSFVMPSFALKENNKEANNDANKETINEVAQEAAKESVNDDSQQNDENNNKKPEEIAQDAMASLEETDKPEQTALQKTAASAIYNAIDNSHLVKDKLEDLTAEKVFDRYLEALDPNKFFFLQSDIDSFKLSKNLFLSHMKSGDLSHEFDIFNLYRQRVEERIRFAIERLHQPFDFTIDEEYILDREDVAWAQNDKEIKDTWRKKIKNDILIEQLNDEELTESEVLNNLQRRYLTLARRTRQLNDYDVFQLIVNAYTHSVEPHTAYLTPRASENFDISMRLSLQGIGAVLEADNEYTVIRRIIPGGPADKDGRLQADERIIGVGQSEDNIIDVIGWRLDDVVDRIRGKKGTDVYLRVLPDEKKPSGKPRIIKITRDNINLEERRAQTTIKELPTDDGDKRFAIINIDSFYIDFNAYRQGDPNYRSTTRDVKEILTNLEDEDIDGIIIDLRNNGGGGLPEAISLAGLFIEEGPIVQIQSFFGGVKIESDPDPKIMYKGPLAVLINQYSASASEIFAGAIQDYNRGILIGEPTFGKGTVQNVLEVSDLRNLGPLSKLFRKKEEPVDIGQLNITMAQFFRVNGSSTQHRGVEPDVLWSTAYIDEETGERAYENSLPWRMIDASDYSVFAPPYNQELIESNIAKHNKRSEKDIDFIYFKKLNELRLKQKDRKVITLNREQRITEHNEIEQELFAIENEKRIAKDEEPYESIEAYHDAREEKEKEKRLSNLPEFDDPYLLEAARILYDFINV